MANEPQSPAIDFEEDFGSDPKAPIPATAQTPAGVKAQTPAPAAKAQAPAKPPVAQPAPPAESETVEISDAQLHALLDKRVSDAQAMVAHGREMETESQKVIREGLRLVNQAQADKHKYFPPTTAAENVRAHIDASNRARAERAEAAKRAGYGAPPASQLDAVRQRFGNINRGGQDQPLGPQGIRAYSRKEAMRLGMVVPNSKAAAEYAPVAFRGGAVKT